MAQNIGKDLTMEKLLQIESLLEDIAYLASSASTVADRMRLDMLLRSTLTYIDAADTAAEAKN